MSYEATRAAIADFFFDEWNQSLLPVVPENQNAPKQDAAWGRFTILHGSSEPMEIGRASVRSVGFVVLQVFVPESQGSKKFAEAADEFADIFDLTRLKTGANYITFETSRVDEVGKTAGWLQRNVRVQFRRDTHA